MKFTISQTSIGVVELEVEINDLDALLNWIADTPREQVVIERGRWRPDEWSIEIYDDYRE